MAGRQKLNRFNQNQLAPNVIERGKTGYVTLRGRWNQDYFEKDQPITVELGCGKGEYTVGLAMQYPNRNFIGVDIKGDRIARGSQLALAAGLSNVAFLRTDVRYLDEFFTADELAELWITFPDPQLRDRREKHRLTHPDFLGMYARFLQPSGLLHLKTDNAPFYAYTLGTLSTANFRLTQATTDLYASPLNEIHQNIRTTYEAIFFAKGFTIHYLQAKRES